MKTAREIKGLKCPNHDHICDGHHFIYETTDGISLRKGTLCLRCGNPKSLHKPQK